MYAVWVQPGANALVGRLYVRILDILHSECSMTRPESVSIPRKAGGFNCESLKAA